MSARLRIDRFLLFSVVLITAIGFVIFLSASLGLLAKGEATLVSVAVKQAISLGIGIVAFIAFSRVKYVRLRKLAMFIFLGALAVNALLFFPALAKNVNGATRWIDLGFTTFQPSELLKIGYIIYIAAWIYFAKDRINRFRFGLLPYLIVTGIVGVLLMFQRDTDTFFIIAVTGLVMLIISGMSWKQVSIAVVLLAIMIAGVVITRPYALARINTFFHPGADAQGHGYQINQSLIAIGSGGLMGRGFGQSVQKFGYLPQPTDDSIFAVAAEEFGFVGSITILLTYAMLISSIFRVALRSPDSFGGMLALGIGVLIILETFINIGAMLGVIPLSGLPLLFVSHGGTALIISLSIAGIVANVSKYRK